MHNSEGRAQTHTHPILCSLPRKERQNGAVDLQLDNHSWGCTSLFVKGKGSGASWALQTILLLGNIAG